VHAGQSRAVVHCRRGAVRVVVVVRVRVVVIVRMRVVMRMRVVVRMVVVMGVVVRMVVAMAIGRSVRFAATAYRAHHATSIS